MPITPLIAAATGVTAAAASLYLDGKYNIRKDINVIFKQRAAVQAVHNMVKHDRACLWSGYYSWLETYDQACRYGMYLRSIGVQPRELVATMLMNSPEFVFNWLGCWSIGCAPALINYHLAGDALLHCIKISTAKVILVDADLEVLQRIDEVRDVLKELGIKIVVLDDDLKSFIDASPATRPHDHLRKGMKTNFPLCLLYTSGSTGHPKAVAFDTGRGAYLGQNRVKNMGLSSGPGGDRFYICMPLYHGTGGVTMVSALLGGASVCIGKKFSTSRFWDEIRASRASAFVYVGETARYLLASPNNGRDKDHQVKLIFGNGMRPDVWVKFRERFGIHTIVEFFNSTEGVFSLINVSTGPFTDACVGQHGGIMRLLMRNYYVAVEVDLETGEIWRDPRTGFAKQKSLEQGGEMLVGVANTQVFAGYWNNQDATDKKFARDVFKKGDLWYRSGDALRRDKDGRWFFMDRLGDTFRWKSENVATADVSERLGYSPGMLEAIVYGVLVPGFDGRAGCAAISLTPDFRPNEQYFQDLLEYSLTHLPKYAVPVFVRLQIESKPMHNQKQNKVPLKADGIDLDRIYGQGQDFVDAKREGRDMVYWWPGGLGRSSSSAEAYVPFCRKDWEALSDDKICAARL